MNNATMFKNVFGIYATELWSMPESDFLSWLKNVDYQVRETRPVIHAHWVFIAKQEQVTDLMGVKTWASTYQCSNCRRIETCIEDHITSFAYCPCCGAVMDESEES